RFRPSVPEKANDTQSTPGTAARIDSRIDSRAKLKITRTTIPKKTMAFRESLVRSSTSRSFRKIVQTLAGIASLFHQGPVSLLKFGETQRPPRHVHAHAAALNDQNPIGQLITERGIMNGHHARLPARMGAGQVIFEKLRSCLVESREWLVQKQDRRIMQERPRNGQSLLHPARIIPHRLSFASRQSHQLDPLFELV